ncbi:MAG: hypothetical protein H6577_21610 [Lewinellaceae bacterium]|nr:hypothetical protein [Saprospiraceae bacterium]MCB9340730.1 hypothetical protein [Lewinellaceae bacterium]
MNSIKWLAFTILTVAIAFTACRLDKDNNVDEGFTESITTTSEDQSTAENYFQDAEDQEDWAIETRDGGGGFTGCPTVTVEPADASFPRTITIDFGDGCEGPYGRIRKGKIIVEQSAAIWEEGSVRTATFDQFFVDNAQIEGLRTIINEGYDQNGNITFSRTVSNGKITFPNGTSTTWESNYLLTQTAGGQTPFILSDNVFEVTGNANGINRNDKAYTATIEEPLLKNKLCPWLSQGLITLTIDSKTLTLDYGTGTCDNKATLTLPNGAQQEITIRRWW